MEEHREASKPSRYSLSADAGAMLCPASCLQKKAPLIPKFVSVSHPTGPEPTMSGCSPDITGSHFQKGWKSSVPVTSGALTGEIGTEWVGGQTSAGGKAYGVSLKASLSSNLFGRSATVQPRAGSFLMCVKI